MCATAPNNALLMPERQNAPVRETGTAEASVGKGSPRNFAGSLFCAAVRLPYARVPLPTQGIPSFSDAERSGLSDLAAKAQDMSAKSRDYAKIFQSKKIMGCFATTFSPCSFVNDARPKKRKRYRFRRLVLPAPAAFYPIPLAYHSVPDFFLVDSALLRQPGRTNTRYNDPGCRLQPFSCRSLPYNSQMRIWGLR